MLCSRACALAVGSLGLLWLLPAASQGQMSPEQTVAGLDSAPGLEAKLWANEPGIQKPTSMDIDSRGRIWVCEGQNYRRVHYSDAGDRIMILEDTHHTGVCDSYKVFVQDKRLNAPLGICVLGDKVIVAMSPDVLVYTMDSTGDHPVGPPEILFTGFAGANHDHGVHKGVFGPDGRFYFNSGNEGTLGYIFHNGKPVVDRLGSEVGLKSKVVDGHPRAPGETGYQDGMAFSCNLDGSDFEVYANDFRNNYELCVDSFGTVWQSDNDDDGNQGTRINYVMEGGSFGYKGPTGTSWDRDLRTFPGQTRQEGEWHQRWPGFVPNLLNTGAGAPTGTVCYEGDLFPPKYRDVLLGADAGRNVIRAYATAPSLEVPVGIFSPVTGELKPDPAAAYPGAGYTAQALEVLKLNEHGDRWFRPSDLCVAPDGSVFVADWYDPGVGGHATGDIKGHLHGRVYRLAPPGFMTPQGKLDLSTMPGQIAALSSPNLATRYLGYTALLKGGESAIPALQDLYRSTNQRLRARALWLLARTPSGPAFVKTALSDGNSDIRVTAIRAARAIKMDMISLADALMTDSSPAVWRELCLAMKYEPTEKAVPILAKLAGKYDGKDRWYLEAFGIGCTGREKQVLAAWQQDNPNAESGIAKGITWRLNKTPTPDQPVPEVAKAGEIVTRPHVPTTPPPPSAFTLSNAADPNKVFSTKDGKTLPSITTLMTMNGNPEKGANVFRNTNGANCVHCHQIGNVGNMIGPPLTAVGAKLNKGQLYEAILYPSASILMHYESWIVQTTGGDVINGLLVEETNDHITIKDTDGKFHDIKLGDIKKKQMQKISLMPEGLSQNMTENDLINLVQYLSDQRP